MIFQEVNWIRKNNDKLCPRIRKNALEWYRPFRLVPCFMQKYFKAIRQRFRKIPVIVQMDETSEINFSIKSFAESNSCKVSKDLTLINGFTTKVNAKSLESLIKSGKVKKIWYDRDVKTVLDVASNVVNSNLLWNRNITGKGVTVAVLDTGIYNHPDLSGRIIGFRDFINGRTSPYDDNGHGTHVAGDIASSGISYNFRYRGPAPEALLVGVKVLDGSGSGTLSGIIQGIQWCIANKSTYSIKVINLSLGSNAVQSYIDDPLCQAVEKAWQSGIVVCAAAGNEGPDYRTISSPGIDPLIITVGALNDMNTISCIDDLVADFSSRGPTIDNLSKPDVLAPGANIVSLRSPSSTLDKQNKQARVGSNYITLSGTSMATPICVGVIAQMLQVNPSLTPNEVKKRLMETATPLSGYDDNIQGAGLINADRASTF